MNAFATACARTKARGAVLATLPDSLAEDLASDLMALGIIPLAGIDEGLAAIELAADIGEAWDVSSPNPEELRPTLGVAPVTLSEWDAKQHLARAGVAVPPNVLVITLRDVMSAASHIGDPAVVKAVSRDLTHKSDTGAMRLNLGDYMHCYVFPFDPFGFVAVLGFPGLGFLSARTSFSGVAPLKRGSAGSYGFLLMPALPKSARCQR